jgi:hypothetical protein
MTYVDSILQPEICDDCGQVIGIVVHVVTVSDLRRSAVTATVMRDYAVTLLQEEQHLRVPVVG